MSNESSIFILKKASNAKILKGFLTRWSPEADEQKSPITWGGAHYRDGLASANGPILTKRHIYVSNPIYFKNTSAMKYQFIFEQPIPICRLCQAHLSFIFSY